MSQFTASLPVARRRNSGVGAEAPTLGIIDRLATPGVTPTPLTVDPMLSQVQALIGDIGQFGGSLRAVGHDMQREQAVKVAASKEAQHQAEIATRGIASRDARNQSLLFEQAVATGKIAIDPTADPLAQAQAHMASLTDGQDATYKSQFDQHTDDFLRTIIKYQNATREHNDAAGLSALADFAYNNPNPEAWSAAMDSANKVYADLPEATRDAPFLKSLNNLADAGTDKAAFDAVAKTFGGKYQGFIDQKAAERDAAERRNQTAIDRQFIEQADSIAIGVNDGITPPEVLKSYAESSDLPASESARLRVSNMAKVAIHKQQIETMKVVKQANIDAINNGAAAIVATAITNGEAWKVKGQPNEKVPDGVGGEVTVNWDNALEQGLNDSFNSLVANDPAFKATGVPPVNQTTVDFAQKNQFVPPTWKGLLNTASTMQNVAFLATADKDPKFASTMMQALDVYRNLRATNRAYASEAAGKNAAFYEAVINVTDAMGGSSPESIQRALTTVARGFATDPHFDQTATAKVNSAASGLDSNWFISLFNDKVNPNNHAEYRDWVYDLAKPSVMMGTDPDKAVEDAVKYLEDKVVNINGRLSRIDDIRMPPIIKENLNDIANSVARKHIAANPMLVTGKLIEGPQDLTLVKHAGESVFTLSYAKSGQIVGGPLNEVTFSYRDLAKQYSDELRQKAIERSSKPPAQFEDSHNRFRLSSP